MNISEPVLPASTQVTVTYRQKIGTCAPRRRNQGPMALSEVSGHLDDGEGAYNVAVIVCAGPHYGDLAVLGDGGLWRATPRQDERPKLPDEVVNLEACKVAFQDIYQVCWGDPNRAAAQRDFEKLARGLSLPHLPVPPRSPRGGRGGLAHRPAAWPAWRRSQD